MGGCFVLTSFVLLTLVFAMIPAFYQSYAARADRVENPDH